MDALTDIIFIVTMTMATIVLWILVDERIQLKKYRKLWAGFIFSMWVGFILVMPLEKILS